jgi:hypothetical protein
MPDGGGDIQVHTDDMLIRPKRMYEYATKVLKEQKGLKLTCSASVEPWRTDPCGNFITPLFAVPIALYRFANGWRRRHSLLGVHKCHAASQGTSTPLASCIA